MKVSKIVVMIVSAAIILMASITMAWATQVPTSISNVNQQVKKLKKRLDTQQQKLNKLMSKIGQLAPHTNKLHVGGGVIIQYRNTNFADFDPREGSKGGDFVFNSLFLQATDQYKGVYLHTEYWFTNQGSMLNHTRLGYNFTRNWNMEVGLLRRPFGILPFAYHGFWYDLAYYTGWDDSQELGVGAHYHKGPWDLRFAFMKNSYNPGSANRMGANLTTGAGAPVPIAGAIGGSSLQQNEMNNEGDLRIAYNFSHGKLFHVNIGASGSYGKIYNNITARNGSRIALATFINGSYGLWGAHLEAINYRNNPVNPSGLSDDTVQMSYFGLKYLIPAKGTIYIVGVSRTLLLGWGPFSAVTLFDDYSLLSRRHYGNYDLGPYKNVGNSTQNTLGAMWHAGRLQIWTGLIMGKNASFSFMGPDNNAWHRRFNISIGYFF